MELTKRFWENVQAHRYSTMDTAPASLMSGLYSLIGDAEVLHSHLEAAQVGENYKWRGVWLTATQIAYVEAGYPSETDLDVEDRGHKGWAATSVTGWVRELQDVSHFVLASATPAASAGLQQARAVSPSYVICFRDQARLTLPFEDGAAAGRDRDNAQRLAVGIRDAVAAQRSGTA
jgi:hypothetical protein